MKSGYSDMRCGLIGEKLGHSFSKIIHERLADYSYELTELEKENVGEFVKSGHFDAFNVTIPYKKTVMPYLDIISPEARAIGAVNTIVKKDGQLFGYNTDYFGFSYMLEKSGIDVKGKKALVLGNGGAAATVKSVLSDMEVRELAVLSSKENTPKNLSIHKDAQIIVNATPVGMYPNNGKTPVDLSLFPECIGVLDLIYNPALTRLLLDAKQRNIPCIGGLSMLVAQAVRAFELFTADAAEEGICERIIKDIENQTKNIILIGMPGCGKTTVGRLIAKKLDRPFFDADGVFTKTYEKTPRDVICEDGEDAFREMEHKIAAELGKASGAVISCGGGVVTRDYNYDVLHQNGTLVFLERALDKLSTKGRPISSANGVEALYNSRIGSYRRFADVRVSSTEIPEKTAELIIEKLGL